MCVLLGDTKLAKYEAEEAVQPLQPENDPEYHNVWSVHATAAQKDGDLLYVKGAHANLFTITMGFGLDCLHDAFGVELKLLLRREPIHRRRRGSGVTDSAAQPVASNKASVHPCSSASNDGLPATAQSIWQHIKFFWDQAEDPEHMIEHASELRYLLFRKQKYEVPKELWIQDVHRVSSCGYQFVEAVVSPKQMLTWVKGVVYLT